MPMLKKEISLVICVTHSQVQINKVFQLINEDVAKRMQQMK
jgi:hypothetical protein